MDDVCELIEEAMAEVRVVVCKRCNGLGEVGLPSLRAECPDCRGCGEIVADDIIVTAPGIAQPTTRREAVLALINTPQEAARFLRTVGYPHSEIVDALIKRFQLTPGEAETIASA